MIRAIRAIAPKTARLLVPIGVLCLVVHFVSACGGGGNQQTDRRDENPQRPALPSLPPLQTTDGDTLDLSEHRGEIVVVEFMSSWCEPCIEGLPQQRRLHEAYAPRGVVFSLVSIDESRADLDALLDEHEVPFTVAHDAESVWFERLRLRFVPSMLIVDANGRIAVLVRNPETLETLDVSQLLDRLLTDG